MGRPYDAEMAELARTFAWAQQYDVTDLRQAVRVASARPLISIGSGGSLTVAVVLASLHQNLSRQLGTTLTPLEVTHSRIETDCSYWLISAGGSNVDINGAAKALITREPSQVAILCGRADSPLAELCIRHPFVDRLVCAPPTGRDGFLATNSLMGFSTLLARAYLEDDEWSAIAEQIRPGLAAKSKTVSNWERLTTPLWGRQTLLVLHGISTLAGATDIESKFVEAALGNVQLADYRNFAHGRHHWLAKRASETAVLALISEGDSVLAGRTLSLLPKTVPVVRLEFPGNAVSAQLQSVAAALRITEWAGRARGIDPGRPAVPTFGRKLYHLPLPPPISSRPSCRLSPRLAKAISRKSGRAIELMPATELPRWVSAFENFRERLVSARFQAIVFDYDGTLVDTRDRFQPVTEAISEPLNDFLANGILIGIATGRGKSVRTELRKCIAKTHWANILVGYYNGAEVAPLAHDDCPDGREGCAEILHVLAQNLAADPELHATAKQTNRQLQITLEPKQPLPEGRIWDLAQQVLLRGSFPGVSVTRSSHSIDILAPGVSKHAVLERLRERLGSEAAILAMGDRGKWPGNDHALLSTPFALSVDEASIDLDTGWNLGTPGQRGIAITLEYLTALRPAVKSVRFSKRAFR